MNTPKPSHPTTPPAGDRSTMCPTPASPLARPAPAGGRRGPALLGLLSLSLLLPPAATLAAATAPAPAPAGTATSAPLAVQVASAGSNRSGAALAFGQLGRAEGLRLQALDGGQSLPFSVRADEVVTGLQLRLHLALSPGLPAEGAHLDLQLNGVPIGHLPLARAQGGSRQVRELAVDASLVTDFNQLHLQLVLPRERVCERGDRDKLWVEVAATSSLSMGVARLPLANDLALLPAPFFDARDNRRLDLPVLLPPRRSPALLQAAGQLASWFGALAAYRGAALTTASDLESLPPGHAVVLATSGNQPAGLALPPIAGPTVAVVDHPRQPGAKLLLVLGRDNEELATALRGLSQRGASLSGALAVLDSVPPAAARQPYDAPNWLPTRRPVRFEELVPSGASALRAQGAHGEPIRIEFRLPPDLHFARQDTVPMDLRWRHTVPPQADRSALKVSANGNPVRHFALAPLGRVSAWWDKPVPGRMAGTQSTLAVPGGVFTGKPNNDVSMRFDYDAPVNDACNPLPASASGGNLLVGEIDGQSSIDFSKVPHFIGLPDLTVFANAGYPYSRMADLSQTAVVLPDEPDAREIDSYLALMSHLGRATGTPATGVRVTSAAEVQSVADRDLLLVGTPARQPLLRLWAHLLPARLDGSNEVALISGEVQPDFWHRLGTSLGWHDDSLRPALGQQPGAAALMGFQSPLAAGRSVVALTAAQPQGLAGVREALLTPQTIGRIHGQATLFEGSAVRSFDEGPSYYNGDVGIFDRLRFVLARHPLALALLLTAASLAMAVSAASGMRKRARRRLAAQLDGPVVEAEALLAESPPTIVPRPPVEAAYETVGSHAPTAVTPGPARPIAP